MVTRTTNIGRDFAHTRQAGFMLGRARSERRDMRGPELGGGAAMRVRRWWREGPLRRVVDEQRGYGERGRSRSCDDRRDFILKLLYMC